MFFCKRYLQKKEKLFLLPILRNSYFVEKKGKGGGQTANLTDFSHLTLLLHKIKIFFFLNKAE